MIGKVITTLISIVTFRNLNIIPMKKKFALISTIVLLIIAALYVAISYFMYDKLSRVTAGGGENAQNIPSSFAMTVEEWPAFDVAPYFMPEFETIHFPSRQTGLNLAGW